MSIDYGATNATENMAQEVHRQIKQKKSAFGQLTRNAEQVVDRRVKDKRRR